MTDINNGEIGVPLRINLGEDISAATNTIIRAQPQIGAAKEFPATVPNTNVTVDGVTLLANQYAEYTTLAKEDLDYTGKWRMKLDAVFSSTDKPQTNYVKFRVLP
ncbi:MAG: hypothetical protein JKX72_02580 [Robiginitomaculum sp.]|nr:hypothetical protein [Robiginitomaculum sp.]